MESTFIGRIDEGLTYCYSGDYPTALQIFQEAVQYLPLSGHLHYLIGLCCLKLGQSEQAHREFDKAARLAPDDAELYANISGAYSEMGDKEREEYYLRLTASMPQDSAGRQFALGILARAEKKYKCAAEHFQAALKWEPDYLKAHLALGTVLVRLCKNDEARVFLQRATEDPFLAASAYHNLGVAERELHHFDAARHAFKAASEAKADFYEALTALSSLELRTGHWLSAWRHFRRAAQCLYPKSIQ